MTTLSSTNVVDLPCVPVILGDDPMTLSLRDVLARAEEIRDLDDGLLPIEREALLRLLESLAAAVLKHHGITDPGGEWLTEAQVDDFFRTFGHLFDLADPDRPFLQEWHTPAPTPTDLAKGYQDLKFLHLREPGASSASWGRSAETRDPADPAVLFLLLVVSWFHGKASNGAGASFYRATSGEKRSPISGAPSGSPRDTVYHLVGDNLAESVLLNIPLDWLTSRGIPAWLDQDLGPAGETPDPAADFVLGASNSPLWRFTWTANRARVRWNEGRPVDVTRGLTRRSIPMVGQGDPAGGIASMKAYAKAVSTGDYCRVVDRKGSTATETKYVHATASLRSAEGFEHWYRHELGAGLSAWTAEDRGAPTDRPGLLLAFHHERGDSYGNRELSQWVTVPLEEVTLPRAQEKQLDLVTRHVETIRKAAGAGLVRAGVDPKSKRFGPMRSTVLASLDDPVLEAVQHLAADEGNTIDPDVVRRVMTRRARQAFEVLTEPLLTLATAPTIYRARAVFAARSATTTKPKPKPNTPEETAR